MRPLTRVLFCEIHHFPSRRAFWPRRPPPRAAAARPPPAAARCSAGSSPTTDTPTSGPRRGGLSSADIRSSTPGAPLRNTQWWLMDAAPMLSPWVCDLSARDTQRHSSLSTGACIFSPVCCAALTSRPPTLFSTETRRRIWRARAPPIIAQSPCASLAQSDPPHPSLLLSPPLPLRTTTTSAAPRRSTQ